ncbi:ShlB/FhaC/HecB family hemolysin secretion/activation protein [Collimonas antrihumi]|uniref:ShlB/FhaC/HecB family hemolysin secretion/activation protein n=1 Tax=Collimonas antrihumi TaxID=1940615 RepID=UPI001B8C69BD|nr:ShlB/FhaC/HecB family hemolysin secretion/activation protein [Collimonas antrihumi]
MGKYTLSNQGGGSLSALARGVGVSLLVATVMHDGLAQTIQTSASEEQRRRSQAEALERQQQLQAPKVNLQTAVPVETLDTSTLPSESPCFAIQQFALEVPSQLPETIRTAGASDLPHDPFRFAQDYLRQYTGACIGKEGLNLIVKRLTNLILSKGYSTTRVGIPEQDLASGTLKLVLVPGVIRAIRFTDTSLYGTWRNAFPTNAGALLNLRDLEQGLEQMKRVPSQDVDMQIVPGEVPGESDVVIEVKRSKPWKLTGTLDDSGAKGTGKLQAGLNLAVDNPLGLSDMFNIGISTDADRKAGQRGTSGNNIYYAIPAGYWNFSVSGSTYDYHQQIAGNNQDFISSGKSRNLEVKIAQLFQRDQVQKNSWQFKVGKRWSHAFIDDTEIAVQQRNTTFAELAWVHKHYFGDAQLDVALANRWGVSWFNGQADLDNREPRTPTFRYTLQSIDATLSVPFKIASQPLTYIGTLRGQNTRSPLYLTDQFSIGNRYTVRGFDGELTLAAERGFFARNELDIPLAQSGQSAYAGIDFGKVYGPSVQYLLGNKLAGATVGVRGGLFGLSYDIFSGWSLYKPQGFRTATPAIGFNLSYQY